MKSTAPALLLLIALIAIRLPAIGQTVIAFQGFEGTAADNWNFVPPAQNMVQPITPVGVNNYGAGYAVSGNKSMRFGGGSAACGTGSANCLANATNGGSCNNNNNGQEVAFSPISVACFTGVSISVAYRTHAACSPGSGEGFDSNEGVFFEVQLDGGAWTTVASVMGSNDCYWTYATNPVVCGSNAPLPNPYVYQVPANTQTVAFRVRLQRNRSNEVLYIDDVTLAGTPGGGLGPVTIQHKNP